LSNSALSWRTLDCAPTAVRACATMSTAMLGRSLQPEQEPVCR
jgi:hypothetical protein